MLFKKTPRRDIPASSNNELYFVDRSFVQFARNYDPEKTSSSAFGQNIGRPSIGSNFTTSSKDNDSSK